MRLVLSILVTLTLTGCRAYNANVSGVLAGTGNKHTKDVLKLFIGPDLDGSTGNGSCTSCHTHSIVDGEESFSWTIGAISTLVQCFDKDLKFLEDRLACLKDQKSNMGFLRTFLAYPKIADQFKVGPKDLQKSFTRFARRVAMPPDGSKALEAKQIEAVFKWITSYSYNHVAPWEPVEGPSAPAPAPAPALPAPPVVAKKKTPIPKDALSFTLKYDKDKVKEKKRALIAMYEEITNLVTVDSILDKQLAACKNTQKNELIQHIANNRNSNWQTINRKANIAMFACPRRDSNPLACFQNKGRDSKPIFANQPQWVDTKKYFKSTPIKPRILMLKNLKDRQTSFFMRISADGRFAAVGGIGFILLENALNKKIPEFIELKDSTDPTFFPNNSAFLFYGQVLENIYAPSANFFSGTPKPKSTEDNQAGLVCNQKILDDPAILKKGKIAFEKPFQLKNTPEQRYCIADSNTGMYQSVATSPTGDSHFVLSNGPWISDDGGTRNIDPQYYDFRKSGDTSNFTIDLFSPLSRAADSKLAHRHEQSVSTPWEYDHFLSVSGKVVVGHQAHPKVPGQQGYAVRLLNIKKNDRVEQLNPITSQKVASICLKGAKPQISYDDRFMVFHHYTDPEDYKHFGYPAKDDRTFLNTERKSSNIWIVDLLRGKQARLTHMGAQQYALFPHFRSDGWMYMLVIDKKRKERYIVASDIAVLIAQGKLSL